MEINIDDDNLVIGFGVALFICILISVCVPPAPVDRRGLVINDESGFII